MGFECTLQNSVRISLQKSERGRFFFLLMRLVVDLTILTASLEQKQRNECLTIVAVYLGWPMTTLR